MLLDTDQEDMDCERFQEEICEYILDDPDVTDKIRAEIEPHMAVCAKCYQLCDETNWVIQFLRENRERVLAVIHRKEREEENEALDSMTDEEFAEALANMELVKESAEKVAASLQRFKARIAALEDEAIAGVSFSGSWSCADVNSPIAGRPYAMSNDHDVSHRD